MSKWGLSYKGVEILTPEEWNAVVDALNELDSRAPAAIKAGRQSFTGDGATTTFSIPHNLGRQPTYVSIQKATANLPDIDHVTADDTYINVTFKSPPASDTSFELWWLALVL